jgi:hypothetical protein
MHDFVEKVIKCTMNAKNNPGCIHAYTLTITPIRVIRVGLTWVYMVT